MSRVCAAKEESKERSPQNCLHAKIHLQVSPVHSHRGLPTLPTLRGSAIVLGWLAVAVLAYYVSNLKVDIKLYDPFEILGIRKVNSIALLILLGNSSVLKGFDRERDQTALEKAFS